MLDVVVATLSNPLAGLHVAVKKIAEKAKEETKQDLHHFRILYAINHICQKRSNLKSLLRLDYKVTVK